MVVNSGNVAVVVDSTVQPAPTPITADDILHSALVHLSPNTRKIYTARWLHYYTWWRHCGLGLPLFSRFSVQTYLRTEHSRSSADVQLSVINAIKAIAGQAEANGTIDAATALQIRTLKPPQKKGVKSGRWLTKEQAARMLHAAVNSRNGTIAARDAALLALTLGCGLRRSELCNLTWNQFEESSEGWLIRNLVGKGNRTRTIKVPKWVWEYIVRWGNVTIEQEGE